MIQVNCNEYFYFFLSFLTDITIEKRESPFNPCIEVKLHNGKYLLDACNVNYSFGKLHEIFVGAFRKISLSQRQVNHALILGFGGGSIAKILREYFPSVKITGIEIDPVIIEVAKKYFLTGNQENLTIHCLNAYDYMLSSNSRYDLIAVDIYFDHVVPEKFGSAEFLKRLKTCLSQGGIIVFNRMITRFHSQVQMNDAINVFRSVFPEARILKVMGNVVLVGEN